MQGLEALLPQSLTQLSRRGQGPVPQESDDRGNAERGPALDRTDHFGRQLRLVDGGQRNDAPRERQPCLLYTSPSPRD